MPYDVFEEKKKITRILNQFKDGISFGALTRKSDCNPHKLKVILDVLKEENIVKIVRIGNNNVVKLK